MSEWQPIETAPRDGTPVLLWDLWSPWKELPCNVVVARWFINEKFTYWQLVDSATADEYPGNNAIDPTHWMPLPEPPK